MSPAGCPHDTCFVKTNEPDRLLTPSEASRELQISVRTLYRLIRSQALPAMRVGRQVRIGRADLAAWLGAFPRTWSSAGVVMTSSGATPPAPAENGLADRVDVPADGPSAQDEDAPGSVPQQPWPVARAPHWDTGWISHRTAGRVAHLLNDALAVILGRSRLLIGQLPERDPLIDDLAEICRAGEQASAVVRQLRLLAERPVPDVDGSGSGDAADIRSRSGSHAH